ncbi:MAG: flagellar hook-basal body complex protein FliE [Candidatus Methylomirabilia bacterium]
MAEINFPLPPLSPIRPAVTPPRAPDEPGVPGVGAAPGLGTPPASFGQALKTAIAEVNQAQLSADEAARSFAVGKTRDVASTMLEVEKANVTFQLMLQVRNRLLEAYQDILRVHA